MHAADLSAVVLNALVERTGRRPGDSSTTWCGAACPRSATSPATSAGTRCWPRAGRRHIPGTTVNRACGSSQQALDFAVQAVMSRSAGRGRRRRCRGDEPGSARLGAGHRHAVRPESACPLRRFLVQPGHLGGDDRREVGICPGPGSTSTPRVARAGGGGSGPRRLRRPDRRRCSPTAARSPPTRASGAGPPSRSSPALKPAFAEDGVIHAGNSSQISDGAAALLVMTAGTRCGPGADADRALPRGRGHRCRSGADAHRPDPGDREGAAQGRRRHRRDRRVRGQRGVRAGAAGLAGRDRRRRDQAQPARRGDRAGPSAGRRRVRC